MRPFGDGTRVPSDLAIESSELTCGNFHADDKKSNLQIKTRATLQKKEIVKPTAPSKTAKERPPGERRDKPACCRG